MDNETITGLNSDLQEIDGEDLTRFIMNYAHRPNEL